MGCIGRDSRLLHHPWKLISKVSLFPWSSTKLVMMYILVCLLFYL